MKKGGLTNLHSFWLSLGNDLPHRGEVIFASPEAWDEISDPNRMPILRHGEPRPHFVYKTTIVLRDDGAIQPFRIGVDEKNEIGFDNNYHE